MEQPTEDLYAVLGVPRNADQKAIHRAYRRGAAHAHPDKPSGSAAAFQRLQLAYAILRDPKRRAVYDRTGEYEDPGPDNSDVAALSLISELLEEICADKGDIFSVDIRSEMVGALKDYCAELGRKLDELTRQRRRAEKLTKRFIRRDGGENVMAAVLRSRVAALSETEAVGRERVGDHQRAIAMLGEYDFLVEAPEPGAYPKRRTSNQLTPEDVLAMLQGRKPSHFFIDPLNKTQP